MDTELINSCLMAKWIWKLYAAEQRLWPEILRENYLRQKDLLEDSHQPGSQFWNSIQKIKEVFSLGAKHSVRTRTPNRLWVDWWSGRTSFKVRLPTLFAISRDPEASVAHCHGTVGWNLLFRRELAPQEQVELVDLMQEIDGIHLSPTPDVISWVLEPSGKFSVCSSYRKLCEGSPRMHFTDLWCIAVPLKIRVFLWQLVRKRLSTNGNIRQRHGPSTDRCALCGEYEDTNHIFFECHLARFMWSAVRELLGCSWNPSCFSNL
jgi:hypothetical protein